MSAWIVDRRHIDVLVHACIGQKLIAPEQADATGRMLWAECLKSVAYRYPGDKGDGDRPGPCSFKDGDVDTYTFTPLPAEFVLTPSALRSTAGCYAYQSCEHPEWETTEAYRLAETLRNCVPESVTRTREYHDVPWGWDDESVEEWAQRQIGRAHV